MIALLGWLIGLLMALRLLFMGVPANPANAWVVFVEAWAPRLDLGLATLAARTDPGVGPWIGYGSAAIIWVAIGTVLSRMVRRIAARRAPA